MTDQDRAINFVALILIRVAGAALLGGTARYFGFSGPVVFAIVVVAIFIASVLIPNKKPPRTEGDTESPSIPRSR